MLLSHRKLSASLNRFLQQARLNELHSSVSILPLPYKRSMSNAPHLKVNSNHAHHLLGILSGNPPDGIVYHSVSRGQPESFFNLDLPIKYAPYPELHGLKWRHKLPTNHGQTEPSQGRCSTVSDIDTTGSALAKHAFPLLYFSYLEI